MNINDESEMCINNTSIQDYRFISSKLTYVNRLIIYGEDSGSIDSGIFLNSIYLQNGFRLYYKRKNTDNKEYLTDQMKTCNQIMIYADNYNLRTFGSGKESISFIFDFITPIILEDIGGEIGIELGVDNYSGANSLLGIVKGYTLI